MSLASPAPRRDLPVDAGYKAALAYCGGDAGPPLLRDSDFLRQLS